MALSLKKSLGRLLAKFNLDNIYGSASRTSSTALHFKDSWAVVIGASDGIGKGFAEELLSQGINTVLHGRDEQKLIRLRKQLLQDWPERDIRVLVLDAYDVASIDLKPIEELNVRILVNNVAATPRKLWMPLVAQTAADLDLVLKANAHFQTEITRQLLPQLVRNQPALILTVGSGVLLLACPYIAAFSSAKAYGEALSRSLRLEMQVEGEDVEVLHLQVGMVQSVTIKRPTSFLVSTSRNFASYAVKMAGCSREVVWPYWPHAVQSGLIGGSPVWLRNKMITGIAKEERALGANT